MNIQNDEVLTHNIFLEMVIMKVAVIGSRGIKLDNLGDYLPKDLTEIVSGGAKGVDTTAREYATEHGIKLTEFLPEYNRYKRGAPLKRNIQIAEYADKVLAFWDGKSRGTKFVIDYCKNSNIPVEVIVVNPTQIQAE